MNFFQKLLSTFNWISSILSKNYCFLYPGLKVLLKINYNLDSIKPQAYKERPGAVELSQILLNE